MNIRDSKEEMLQAIQMFDEMLNGTSQRKIADAYCLSLSKVQLRLTAIRQRVYKRLPDNLKETVWKKDDFVQNSAVIRETLALVRNEIVAEFESET